MKKILVSGLINIETSLKVESFHLDNVKILYPFFGITSYISGSGINIAKAIQSLGGKSVLCSIIGLDNSAGSVYEDLHNNKMVTKYVFEHLKETAQSVVIYDNQGNSQKHIDLKDVQEKTYPINELKSVLKTCSIAALCNINFSRSLLKEAKKHTLIATDVQGISKTNDEYNKEFMEYADILFLSSNNISYDVKDFVLELAETYKPRIIVVGMGNAGAMMYYRDDNFLNIFPAVYTRPLINKAGAGDALFASFIYYYNTTKDPYLSLKNAIIFSSYKIGAKTSSEGFLSDKELSVLPYSIL